jgi:hypothetical protein
MEIEAEVGFGHVNQQRRARLLDARDADERAKGVA